MKLKTELTKLEIIEQVILAELTKEFAEDIVVDVSAHSDFLVDRFLIRIIRKQLAKKAGDRIIRYPENWIEAIKERWFPAWLKKRRPVKYKEYDALIIFPDLLKKYPVPKGARDQNFYFTYAESGTILKGE